MPEIRRYRNGKIQTHKVFVMTDDEALTIEIKLMRSPIWTDEHSMKFNTLGEYRKVEDDIITTLRNKGFIFYVE